MEFAFPPGSGPRLLFGHRLKVHTLHTELTDSRQRQICLTVSRSVEVQHSMCTMHLSKKTLRKDDGCFPAVIAEYDACCHCPKIAPCEWRAFNTLRPVDSIVITKADKGKP
ncbi:hypothetical protein T265_07013 [Opisthorchis viverrini]|uniref:Uncharacterized protein n=1 Tax=Opisthorchis viverrini TaxID=6198 RepID=A0A075ACP2_OPIVI|nr:hypothetical protein T265_07013 [Opisthorchis viverrini]KER25554.1 hypothetical protein T265_07013 [Opisthorchis viverrini]